MNEIQEYLKSTFEIDDNTSATIIITVFIFFCGFLIQQLISSFTKYLERHKTRKIFRISLREFYKQVEKQSEAYLETSRTFSFDRESPFAFTRATIFSISSIQSLGYQKTYEAFFFGFENWILINQNIKLKAFNKIWDSIKSVEFWHEKSFNDINFFIDKYNLFNERRNKAIENHRRFFEPIMTQFNGQQLPAVLGNYLNQADQIHVDWQNYPNRTNPNIVHRQLVIRLRILNRKNINIPIANRMNDNLLEATMEYQNQMNLLKSQRIQFITYYRSFRTYARLCKIGNKILK